MPWADRPTPGPNDSLPEAERPPHGEGVAGNPEGGSEALPVPPLPTVAEGGYLPPPYTPSDVVTAGHIASAWADLLGQINRAAPALLGRGRLAGDPHKITFRSAYLFSLSLLLPGEGVLCARFTCEFLPTRSTAREAKRQIQYQLQKALERMLRRRDEIRFTLAEEVLKGSGATWDEVALAYDHDDARPYPRFTGGEREREREHRVIPARIVGGSGQRTELRPVLDTPEGFSLPDLPDAFRPQEWDV